MSTTGLLAHADQGGGGSSGTFVMLTLVAVAGLWLVRVNRRLDRTEDPMPSRRRRSRYEWFLIACLAVSIAGFVFFLVRPDPEPPEAQLVIDSLCRAVDEAATNPDTALDTFNSGPHLAFHDLDGDLRREDPVLAVRLSDAKTAAEEAMTTGADDAAARTATLAATMIERYRALDVTVEGCSQAASGSAETDG